MKLFIILFILSFQNTFAFCRVDENEIDQAGNDPKIAKTIAIGKISKESNKLFFVSEKPWDKIKVQLMLEGCMKQKTFKENTEVLFISTTDYLKLNNTQVDLTKGTFIEFENLSAIANGLKAIKELPRGKFNLLWKNCFSDKECEVVQNKCGGDEVINSLYKDYLLKNLDPLNCNLQSRVKKIGKPMCVNYFCK